MLPLVFLGLTVLVIVLHLVLRRNKKAKNILEIIILDYLLIAVGLLQTLAGLGHIFNGPEVARSIGWAAGSPFQYEVGVANLAIGLTALLAFWFRGGYWLAVSLISGLFCLGAGVGHWRALLVQGNTAVYNSGPILYLSDGILPILLIVLVIIYLRNTQQRK